jgi:nucleoid-associated protein YgaU
MFLATVFLGFVSIQKLSAQEKMSKDDWQQQMQTATAHRADLQKQADALDKDITDLNAKLATATQDAKACHDALLALLGVTQDQMDQFDRDLTTMEKRVTELQAMSDDELMKYQGEIKQMQAKLDEMSKTNFAKLSRFASRITALHSKLEALLKSAMGREKSYTVGTWKKDRDCLWNIAKKPDIYANAWMWPKIWQGNRDKIKDPDLIKPKWVLKIPEGTELSKSEKSAAKKYYHKKAAVNS